jgi:hypothetical protein
MVIDAGKCIRPGVLKKAGDLPRQPDVLNEDAC